MKTVTLLLFFLLALATGTQAQSCAVSTNVLVGSATATTAVVSFTPGALATGYLVRYFRMGGTSPSGIIQQPTASSPITLANLQPASSYSVSVASICPTGGDTLYSAPRVFTTSGGSSACASVTNLQVSAITATGATIGFTPASGAVSYLINYYVAGDSTNTHTLSTSQTTLPLTQLLAGTRYIVRITTVCGNGHVSSPTIGTFQTSGSNAACSAVTNVTVTGSSSSTANVAFTPGTGNTIFYVSYHLAGDSTHWVSGTSSPLILTGLVPGQTYYVQVLSSCGASGTVTFTSSGSTVFNFRGAAALGTQSALSVGSFVVYPNPAYHAVYLLLPPVAGATSASITLFSAVGQQVRSSTVTLTGTTTQAQLELTDLLPGLYTVRIFAAGRYASQRLAVE